MTKSLKLATRLTDKHANQRRAKRDQIQSGPRPSDLRVQKLRYIQNMHTINIQQGSFSVKNVAPKLRSSTNDGVNLLNKASVAMQDCGQETQSVG